MGRSVWHWVCVFALVAVPLVGCGDETTAAGGSGDTGGDGGTGGTAGSGGSGAAGGSGGTGGILCEQRCGVGNTVNSERESDRHSLRCRAFGFEVPLFDIMLSGQVAGGGGAMVGANTYDLQVEIRLYRILQFLEPFPGSPMIEDVVATVAPTAGTSDTNTLAIALDGTPCELCEDPPPPFPGEIEPQARWYTVPLPVAQGMWDLNDGFVQTFELTNVTIGLTGGGLPFVFSSAGDDSNCTWDSVPPSISFTVPE